MAGIRHLFNCVISDDPAATTAGKVTPSKWNEDHEIDDDTLSIAKTIGLQSALDGKAASSHTHTASQITDFSTAADARITAQKAQNSGLATLDSGGKIPTSQLPALAISSTFVVNSQAAQLALSAQEGDVAVRTDQNKSYIQNGGTAGTMADWTELLTPTDSVLSVNGLTGAVTLTSSNVAEGTNLYHTAARAIAAPLTGFSASAGTVAATDTILQAFNKIVGNIAGFIVDLAAGVTGLLGLTNGGTGASTARAACANLKSPHILAQSGVASSVTGTTSETTLATITVPANAMGANGAVRIWCAWSWTNNGNSKTPRIRFGGTGGTVFTSNTLTTSQSVQDVKIIQNRNATNSQVGTTNTIGGFSNSSVATVTAAIDTTAAVDIVISGQLANSADTLTLERYLVELLVP